MNQMVSLLGMQIHDMTDLHLHVNSEVTYSGATMRWLCRHASSSPSQDWQVLQ